MAQIILRNVKNSPLTNQEVDDNFNILNTLATAALPAANYTAADVLTKLKTVDGSGSGLDADLFRGYGIDTANTVSTVVLRDSNGDFYAGTIRANLIGNTAGVHTGNVTGNVSGTALNVTGTVAVANGGTGAGDAISARTNLGLGTISTQAANNVNITGGSISGITALPIASGGTGATTANAARSNLGVQVGSDVQPFSNELTGIAAATGTGFYVRTGSASVVQRTFTIGTNGLSLTNGSGVSGNPVIDISSTAAIAITSLTTSAGASIGGALTVGTNLSVSGTTTLVGLNVGNITSSGTITAAGNIIGFYSDDRLKTKLGKIENALDKLCSLEGFYFEANETAKELGYTGEKQVGISAQSTQAVLPEVVHPAPIGQDYLTVDYSRVLPLVIEAIKELRAEIQALK